MSQRQVSNQTGLANRQVIKSDRVVTWYKWCCIAGPVQTGSLSCPTCEPCGLRTDLLYII